AVRPGPEGLRRCSRPECGTGIAVLQVLTCESRDLYIGDSGRTRSVAMSTDEETRSIVRAYHKAWTSGDFETAVALLDRDLEVEVPINEYPTKGSFADALRGFGPLVIKLELLSELAEGDEAMLLYDMDVEGLGGMRVAEHFTVRDGRIRRLRQIHDTAAVRAA